MEVTMNHHDCSEQLADQQHPAMFLTEPAISSYVNASGKPTESRLGQWYVLDTVLGHPDGLTWNIPMQGEKNIRIPLFSYTTTKKDLGELFAVGVHLMTSIMAHPTVGPMDIERAHIVIGNVYDGGPEKGYQVWIGLAFRVPSRG